LFFGRLFFEDFARKFPGNIVILYFAKGFLVRHSDHSEESVFLFCRATRIRQFRK